ncbi:MAG: TolC family protein [Putridiphycobacter sp.]|nr:TolC family protein [Putridiphycobacter sp.]
MKLSILNTIIGLFMFSTVFGQDEKTTFSVAEAESYALEHAEKIKNASLDIVAAEKKVWETLAIGLPQVSIDGQFQQLLDIPVQVIDASFFNPSAPPGTLTTLQFGQEFTANAALGVNQLLFDGSYVVGIQFSKYYKKVAETALAKTQQDTKALVREAYYNALVAQRNVDLLDSIAITTKQLWDQSKGYFKAGFMLQEDIDQFEIAFNRMELNLSNAKNQLNIAKNFLKLQMGLSLDKDITLSETFDEVVLGIESNNPALNSFSIENNFNYILMEQQKVLSEFNLKNEKAGYLPSAYAFFNHQQNAFRNEFDFFQDKPWYPTTLWGIGISIPVTSSGQRVMKVQQAEIRLEKDQNSVEEIKRTLEFQELQLKSMFINAYEKMHLEEKNVALAHSIYNKALARKEVGAVSALDVTQKQNQLLQAEGSYIGAVMEMLNYKIEIDKLYNQ